MTFRRLLFSGLCCLAFACARAPASGGNLNDPCASNADCNAPFICDDAKCSFDKKAVCDIGATRCNGDAIEACAGNAGDTIHGNRWEVKNGDADHCKTGCHMVYASDTDHVGKAQCRTSECVAGTTRCAPTGDGNIKETIVQQCDASGAKWNDVFACPTTCEIAGGQAQCSTQVCEPFANRCKDGTKNTLQTCNGRGTSWTDSDCPKDDANNPYACVDGRCLPTVCSVTADGATITRRDERCNGVVAEQCNDTQTAWVPKQVCNNGCDFDATAKKATCAAAACTPYTTQCKTDLKTLQTCNARGTAWVDTACNSESRCVNGACVPKLCSVTRTGSNITGRQTRCTGEVREQCNDTETAWEPVEVCQFGCGMTNNVATCAAAVCNAGDMTCAGADGNALEICAPDRVSYDFVQYCPAGCAKDTTKTPVAAACKPTTCSPLARRCGYDAPTDTSFVEVCAADGSGWSKIEGCAQTCSTGFCTVTNALCTAGASRCVGSEVESCVMMANGATQWRFQDHCLGSCDNGVCSTGDGAIGCLGGANASLNCGAPTRQPVKLHPLLASATEAIPCDGYGRVLVYSDPIVGSDGMLVPDGTLVTFAHDVTADAPTENLLGSGDADPLTPGLQRPTLHGVVMVVINAPASCAAARTVNVTASFGGRARGTVGVNFQPPQVTSPPTKRIYVAEDFSTPRNYDRASTADWNFTLGAAVALPAFNLGTGKDGDYTVTDKQVHDLSAEGYARAWGITRISGYEISVDNVLPTLSTGDEVLITTLWSQNASTIGVWETRRVASVATGRVILTEPVRNVYGNAGDNDDFTDVRAVVQRIPQFNAVTIGDQTTLSTAIPTAGTLSTGATGVTGGGTGIVAFRARGTVRVLGKIDLVGKGVPGTVGITPPPNGGDRLAIGRPTASGAGGGAAFINAATLTFKDANGNAAGATANVNVNGAGASGSGGAGAMYVKGGDFVLGTNATRFLGGTANAIHLDYGKIDNNPLATPAPATLPATPATSVQVSENGAFTVQSTTAYDEMAAVGPLGQALNIFTSDLVGVIGGAGSTTALAPIPTTGGLQSVLPAFSVFTSADGGSYGFAGADQSGGRVSYSISTACEPVVKGAPCVGRQFKWRALMSTLDDRPVYLRGIAFKVNLQ